MLCEEGVRCEGRRGEAEAEFAMSCGRLGS